MNKFTAQKSKKIGQDEKGCGAKRLDTSLKSIDGVYTKEKGVLCTAFFADCVPLFFLDPVSGLIGIAHAGWRGTVGRIAEKMVWKLTEYGATKSSLLAVIGPCISKANYEVDHQVISNISDKDQAIAATPLANGRFLLDLKKLNAKILHDAGLPEKNIAVTNYCTFDDETLFFSHRRDQGKTGRMLAFIGYRDYI
ncbi:peptidoglycan editing factor PgeF [Virgibacillus halophilus]|uniref:Purine nucleoside phosphorylase n=1 Tax=Tigheibacillus halophilus TaxID=361280 RepID=A0ABU5CAD3_9BACI|nr:peptidoglycan editing factor PgeF [Virgibacillus halophilus]